MCQIAVLPGILLMITGLILFTVLLYFSGHINSRHLKKQSKTKFRETKSKKIALVIFYILSLISIILSAGFSVRF